MLRVDLNADMGEGYDQDEAIMDWVSSVNIACGYHAGDAAIIRKTIALARSKNIAIGAHPSYPDREHFGRRAMNLSPHEVYQLITEQLQVIGLIASETGATISHVKPHGALYNEAAKNEKLAASIAKAVLDYNKELILFGLSGSQLILQAEQVGLSSASEVFADRAYIDDGSLAPRNDTRALITDADEAVQQVLQMVHEEMVQSLSGKKIHLRADTICIHGDQQHATEFARRLNNELIKNDILIMAPSKK